MKREDATARVWRGVATESFVSVIPEYGRTSIKVHWCKSCRQWKPLPEFYLESSSKIKYKDQPRSVCIPCWDKRNGSIFKFEPSKETLEQFIMEQS